MAARQPSVRPYSAKGTAIFSRETWQPPHRKRTDATDRVLAGLAYVVSVVVCFSLAGYALFHLLT